MLQNPSILPALCLILQIVLDKLRLRQTTVLDGDLSRVQAAQFDDVDMANIELLLDLV